MAARVGVAAERLLVPFQIHSADAMTVSQPWAPDARPRCDGLVTSEPGLALGVTGADCGMLLFADARAGVVGACHAGWKGAFTGMIEATVAAMEAQRARRADIHVALGPAIGPESYEVGPEFSERFLEADPDYARFFAPSSARGTQHVRPAGLHRHAGVAAGGRLLRGARRRHLRRRDALLQLSAQRASAGA